MGQQGLEEKESKKADIQSGQGVDVCTLGVTAGVMKTWPTRPGLSLMSPNRACSSHAAFVNRRDFAAGSVEYSPSMPWSLVDVMPSNSRNTLITPLAQCFLRNVHPLPGDC